MQCESGVALVDGSLTGRALERRISMPIVFDEVRGNSFLMHSRD